MLGYIGLSKAIFGYVWLYLAISCYLCLSLTISDHLYQVSSIMVQVEAGDSKLLLFETFLLFLIILFLLSRTSYRGARAPKNTNWFNMKESNIFVIGVTIIQL